MQRQAGFAERDASGKAEQFKKDKAVRNWVHKAIVIAAFALPAVGLASNAAEAASCAFSYEGDLRNGDYRIDLQPLCASLNNQLAVASIEPTGLTLRWSGQNSVKGQFCSSHTYVNDMTSGTNHVLYLGHSERYGRYCRGELPTPGRPNNPAKSPNFGQTKAHEAANQLLKGSDWIGDGITQVILSAFYRPSAEPGAVWPIVVRIVRGGGQGAQWQVKSYEFVCVDGLSGKNTAPGCVAPIKYKRTSAWLDMRLDVVVAPKVVNAVGANETGWHSYKILNLPATDPQRLDRVTFQYQDGGGTVIHLNWQEYCVPTSYFVQAARQHFLATTGKDICTCTANSNGTCQ